MKEGDSGESPTPGAPNKTITSLFGEKKAEIVPIYEKMCRRISRGLNPSLFPLALGRRKHVAPCHEAIDDLAIV